jgi:hypothetical protein
MLLLRVEVVNRTCQVERLQKKESATGTQVWKGKARARDGSRHLGLSVRTALHCVVYRRAGDAKSDCNFRRCCCAVVLHTYTLSLLCNRNAAVDKNGMVFFSFPGAVVAVRGESASICIPPSIHTLKHAVPRGTTRRIR